MKAILLAFALLLHWHTPGKAVPNSFYVDAGSAQPFTDSTGQVWSADTGFYNVGNVSTACPTQTASGPDPGLYKTARWGPPAPSPEMVYTFNNLASGTYAVNLYFDECVYSAANQRIFSVNVNNAATPQIVNLDIFVEAPGRNVPLVKTVYVSVTNGTLPIKFIHVKDNPLLAAISLQLVHIATLKWIDNGNPAGSVNYNVYRATGACANATFAKIASGVPGFTYIDPTIAPQTSYCYQITAVAAGTESLPCAAVFVPGSITSCNCQ